MQPILTRYKIGLGIIGLFTLAIAVMVLVQAAAIKQDTQTFKTATKAAEKLNTYMDTAEKLPTSLADAGIRDTDNISYRTVSDTKYEFCVTYRADSSGFDAAAVENQLLTSAYGSGYSSSSPDKEVSALYLENTHHKGANCQTIKPYLSSSPSYPDYGNAGGEGSTNDPAADCPYDPANTNAYYDCVDKAYGTSTN